MASICHSVSPVMNSFAAKVIWVYVSLVSLSRLWSIIDSALCCIATATYDTFSVLVEIPV